MVHLLAIASLFPFAVNAISSPATAPMATMADLVASSESAARAGYAYLQTAQRMPSNVGALDAISAADSQLQEQLASALLAEEHRNAGTDIGPGGGPGMRLQSPGRPCPSCAHDYSYECPAGWSPDNTMEGSGLCEAMSSYDGPCPASAFVGNLERADKEAFETRCSVCWPCEQALSPQ